MLEIYTKIGKGLIGNESVKIMPLATDSDGGIEVQESLLESRVHLGNGHQSLVLCNS